MARTVRTVKRLPPEIRSRLDELLRDESVTQTEATDLTNALLADSHPEHPPLSRHVVSRYDLVGRRGGLRRSDLERIAKRTKPDTTDGAAAAGDEVGALLAPLTPFGLRMFFLKALASRLADDCFDAVKAEERSAGLVAEVELTPEEARAGSGRSFTLGKLARAHDVWRSGIQGLASHAGWRCIREPHPCGRGCKTLYPFEELPGIIARKAPICRARRGTR